ncbi:hypothetical protein Tco_0390430 [Tanacetum coccineum]
MTWHSKERVDDGLMRHPADSPAWKMFDKKYPEFGCESRNVRLGLASDGFNPFRTMTISHSTWPVVLIPYNLPPWLCMKQPSFILSVLIDGIKAPGDMIDVYLQPLINELKDLWHDGVSTYAASSKSMFQLHAALLWTISDFPAYAKLSGWSTQGRLACPTCNIKTRSFRLKHSHKFCFLGHQRWLKESHKLRRDKAAFNGEPEWDPRPRVLSGSELLDQLKDVETVYKKEDVFKKRKIEELEKENERVRKDSLRSEKRKIKEKMKGKGKMNIKIFPPSFFDIIEHLPIHLAEEALLAGPVQYRYLLTLKMYVCNRARLEGCIAKGALMEECMTFCARYLKDIKTKSTRPDRNYSGEDNMGSHFGIETPFFLDHLSMEQAHRYLLASTDAVAPYREIHLRSLQKLAPRERQRLHNKEFPSWFRADARVLKQVVQKKVLTTEIIDMAMGLTNMAKRYNGYVVNGFRFRTKNERRSIHEGEEMWVRHGVEGTFVEKRAARSSTIENQQQNNLVHVVESDSDEEMEDKSEAHISDESEEEFDDTIDDTSDNDGVGNMRDDESDDD